MKCLPRVKTGCLAIAASLCVMITMLLHATLYHAATCRTLSGLTRARAPAVRSLHKRQLAVNRMSYKSVRHQVLMTFADVA